MDELYQAEWCPHSRRVRQRFAESGVSYIARPVRPTPPTRRNCAASLEPMKSLRCRSRMGAINGGADRIIAYLDHHYSARADARRNRERAIEFAEN